MYWKWFELIEWIDRTGHRLGYLPDFLCDYYDRLVWQQFDL